jgi:membrane protein
VAVPTLQSILIGGAKNLPFGLAGVNDIVFAVSLVAGVAILFAILCVIYWTVPNRLVPWRAIWPGALGATIAIGLVDIAFPAYIDNISSIAKLGTSLIFVLIVLIWFYAIAIIVLGGAVINATRFEIYETGELTMKRD